MFCFPRQSVHKIFRMQTLSVWRILLLRGKDTKKGYFVKYFN